MSVEQRQIAVQELWKAIDAGDPEAVLRWAEIYAALLRGDKVAMWDTTTGAREL